MFQQSLPIFSEKITDGFDFFGPFLSALSFHSLYKFKLILKAVS